MKHLHEKSVNSEKKGPFSASKSQRFHGKRVFFSHRISEKGLFFKLENTDGLNILHWSGGTGGTSNYLAEFKKTLKLILKFF